MANKHDAHISEEQRIAIEKMFKAIAPNKFERWCYLLDRPPARWDKISPIDAWPLKSVYDSYPDVPISELIVMPQLAKWLNKTVFVLRCGHSGNPGVATMLLKDVFPKGEWDYEILFEGFVCVDPGKMAIAANHEGGLYLYGVQSRAT